MERLTKSKRTARPVAPVHDGDGEGAALTSSSRQRANAMRLPLQVTRQAADYAAGCDVVCPV